ncbi:hypothetical protein K505DRAFT_16055 [Melanomma pulvis-pyrius CBS 109.77]|uniref:Uncharacterized protein n=1 Tax=Melanomma pulvis-pyrius CBS 109.77 TaxID=1314802 RepID=A0A6A6XFI2_9PLEO|nr:hypothetical protein K505DRAFT_16055 [Melanomma pulvis-pyrius CBS 109.77]
MGLLPPPSSLHEPAHSLSGRASTARALRGLSIMATALPQSQGPAQMRPSCGASAVRVPSQRGLAALHSHPSPSSPAPSSTPPPHPSPSSTPLGERLCPKLSPFQISAAKAPPGVLSNQAPMWFPSSPLPTCHLISLLLFGNPQTRVLSYRPSVPQAVLPFTLASSLFRSPALLFLLFILFIYWSGLLSALAAKGTLFSIHSFNCLCSFLLSSHPQLKSHRTID